MMICCWTCDQVSGYELSFNNPEMNLMKKEFGWEQRYVEPEHIVSLSKGMSILYDCSQ